MLDQLRILVVGQKDGWFARNVKYQASLQNIHIDNCRANGDLIINCDKDGIQIKVNGEDVFSYDLIHFFTVQDNRSLWYAVAGEAAKQGIKIIDKNCYATLVSDQSLLSRLSLQIDECVKFPKTIIVSSLLQALVALKSLRKPVVLKTLNSRKGSGVTLVRSWFDVVKFKVEHRRNNTFAFREYIHANGDFRITVIDGKAYSAIFRSARNGEWRNNLSLGARGTKVELGEIDDLVKIAEKVSVLFGFDIAGVDIMVSSDGEPYVLEVNRSPQLEASEKITGVNLTREVVNMYRKKCSVN